MPVKRKPKVEPIAENLTIISFQYGVDIILPHGDGIKIMEALSKAEVYKNNYDKPDAISDLTGSEIKMSILAKSKYNEIKMNQLIGVEDE